MKKKIMFIVGTRPEFIKILPVIDALKMASFSEIVLGFSSQHSKNVINFSPDLVQLDGIRVFHAPKFSHVEVSNLVNIASPDLIVVQGDTNSARYGAEAAGKSGISLVHLEAGLRTYASQPWPEEQNRVQISRLAQLHFPPSERAAVNLLSEGISPSDIVVSGGTGIDAVRKVVDGLGFLSPSPNRNILCTIHRSENRGYRAQEILQAIHRIASFPNVRFVILRHHSNPLCEILDAENLSNVFVVNAVSHAGCIQMIMNSMFVLTDSGGLQEEASYLGRPCVVLRDSTERQETIDCNSSILVGSNSDAIVGVSHSLLSGGDLWRAMAVRRYPYGYGFASEIVVEELLRRGVV